MFSMASLSDAVSTVVQPPLTRGKDSIADDYQLLRFTFQALSNPPREHGAPRLHTLSEAAVIRACNQGHSITTLEQARNAVAGVREIIDLGKVAAPFFVPGSMAPQLLARHITQAGISVADALERPLAQVLYDLPASGRIPLLEEAVRAGLSMASVGRLLPLRTPLHPDLRHLEEVAVRGPRVAQAVAAGQSQAQIEATFGPFISPLAISWLDNLFLQV
jgi:hypothetical protein